jgi:hypothetical protein
VKWKQTQGTSNRRRTRPSASLTHSLTQSLPQQAYSLQRHTVTKATFTTTVPILRRIVRAATDKDRWQLRADYMEYFHLLSPRNANVAP